MQMHSVSVLMEGGACVSLLDVLRTHRVLSSPVQRTDGGYSYESGGHVISICLHRRTVIKLVQRPQAATYDRKIRGAGVGMVRRKIMSAPSHAVLACLDCPSTAAQSVRRTMTITQTIMSPWTSVRPVAQGDGRQRSWGGPVRSSS